VVGVLVVALRDPLHPALYPGPLNAPGSAARPTGGRRPSISRIGRAARLVALALVVAFAFRAFCYEGFYIPSGSMMSTLVVGDEVLVAKFAYGGAWARLGGGQKRLPTRGDIIVFTLPRDPATDYIKRVVGLPGDRIQMIDGTLQLNGSPVSEERVGDFVDPATSGEQRVPQLVERLPGAAGFPLLKQKEHGALDDTEAWTVPPGMVFVMGDNRDSSEDSRAMDSIGFVPVDNIVGKAEIRLFSLAGRTQWWEVWKWPTALRMDRVLTRVR
jgi:signal peptidase I